MDATRFDAIAQAMANGENRRSLVKMLAGSALGGLVLAGAGGAEAKKKKKKKIEVCHSGATIKVSKKGKKKHLKHGDSIGPCGDGTTTTTPPPPDHCKDGVKNEGESDVDCGGTCPRCLDGKACNSRNDCASALCVNGVCKSCSDVDKCGNEADSVTPCFCRDSKLVPGTKVCSNQVGRNFTGDACNQCTVDEGCFATDGGANTECNKFCGVA